MEKLAKGTYFVVPSEMIKGINPFAQLVYIWLCKYSNQDNLCFPSIPTLQKDSNLSRCTILRSLKLLLQLGCIEKTKTSRNKNVYKIRVKNTSEENQKDNRVVSHRDYSSLSQRLLVVSHRDYNYLKENNLNQICSSGDERKIENGKKEEKILGTKGFETFWQFYPRKVGKKKAFQKWQEKKCDVMVDDILDDVKLRLKERQPNGWLERVSGKMLSMTFIPHPVKYLIEERWEDEYAYE